MTKSDNRTLSRRELLAMAAGAAALAACGDVSATMPRSVIKRGIPSTGEKLPVIGMGTWQTFDVGTSGAARKPLEAVLSEFVRLGGRLIDSSPMYGNSERVAGDLAKKTGVLAQLFVATKVWTSGEKAGIEQMERSAQLLQTPRIDLMQVHNLVDVDTHLATLRRWKDAERIRYIGVTHYHSGAYDHVERVMKSEKLDFLQINYSIQEREADRRLLPLAADRGIAVIANRPYAGGDLFGRVHRQPLPPLATELGCESWGQFFLKFIIGHPSITCAIPATSKVEHLRDNMGAAHGPIPDANQRKRMVELVARL
ncbi:MAG TPA: aldo/keto reductase [Thermoanaerobaculia bacterium]|nr:aldo/keto reductase [Thermoanaerobaculia bacterium]